MFNFHEYNHLFIGCVYLYFFVWTEPFFSFRFLQPPNYPTKTWLERVLIVGISPGVSKAQAISNLGNLVLYLHIKFIFIYLSISKHILCSYILLVCIILMCELI